MSEIDDVSLREHVEALFAEKEKALQAALLAQEKAVAAALDASDKAINKAEINAEKWRDSANEWRGAMSDRDRELPSRREVDAALSAVSDRVASIETWMSNQQGRTAGIGMSAGLLVGTLTAATAVLGIVIVVANLLTT